MRYWVAAAALLIATPGMTENLSAEPVNGSKPTIVLVHGAFAGSSSWNGVIADLHRDGFRVIAAANPLRGVAGDANYVARLVASIAGPVVLVGHSYGGEVISVAAASEHNVKALVFVAGFAPAVGESAASLSSQFPTGTLGETLAPPVELSDGNKDAYIQEARYWQQFAADVPKDDASSMAATQRPVTMAALEEPAQAQSWDRLPSFFIWGSLDRNIPATLHRFMANRAKAKEAIEIPAASHVVMISNPAAVAGLIERAAR